MKKKLKKTDKDYICNKDFYNEIIISLEQKKLTVTAQNMIILLANRVSRKMVYTNTDDRHDCISYALIDAFKYWHKFNPERSNNPFSFFTQVIKNGLAKGWNILHPKNSPKFISLDSGYSEDNNGIYSI